MSDNDKQLKQNENWCQKSKANEVDSFCFIELIHILWMLFSRILHNNENLKKLSNSLE